MRLAQVVDPTALAPIQQLLKERQERHAEREEFEALKAALKAAQNPQLRGEESEVIRRCPSARSY